MIAKIVVSTVRTIFAGLFIQVNVGAVPKIFIGPLVLLMQNLMNSRVLNPRPMKLHILQYATSLKLPKL